MLLHSIIISLPPNLTENNVSQNKINTEALLEHLKVKWQGRPCQQCSIGNWSVQDTAYELRQFSNGSLVAGGTVMPVIPVICSNCGNTILVNAIIAGAVDLDKSKKGGGTP